MVMNAPVTPVRMEDDVTTKRMISFVNADADILASCARLVSYSNIHGIVFGPENLMYLIISPWNKP